MVEVSFGETCVVEDQRSLAAAYRFKFEADDGVDAGTPRSGSPGLHEPLHGDNFDIPALDQAAKRGESAARNGVDRGRHSGKGGELFAVEEHIEYALRRGPQIDLLMKRGARLVGSRGRLLPHRGLLAHSPVPEEGAAERNCDATNGPAARRPVAIAFHHPDLPG
jgi:hypothetical protein